MKTSETTGAIAAALAKARAAFTPIERNRTAPVTRNENGPTRSYSTIDDVLKAVTPALCANELALVQGPAEGGELATRLMHSSGEWIETLSPIHQGSQPGAQGYGSGLTYARRYAAMAILNVAPEEDDDGAKADGRVATRRPENRNGTAPPPAKPGGLSQQVAAAANGDARAIDESYAEKAIAQLSGRESVELIANAMSAMHPRLLEMRTRGSHDLVERIVAAADARRAALTGHQPPTPPREINHANGANGHAG